MRVKFTAEQLHWIALDWVGVPNKVATECCVRVYCTLKNQL